jgi:Ca-activated chloride channel homolog
MIFASPWVLLLLILIPIIICLYLFNSNQSSLKLSITNYKHSFSNLFDGLGFHLPFALRSLVLILIIILLARPQFGQSHSNSKQLGLDILLAVDTSQSMSAIDLKLNGNNVDRLTVVKSILRDFIKKRNSDRLGLLVFGEHAYTQCPLTTDHGAILDLLDHIQIGMVGPATAIGSAIAIGVKRLKDLKAKSRILILMTDGENTAGNISPQLATELAKETGIKIYTIGVGQDGEVPMKIQTPFGVQTIRQIFHVDENSLTQIAEQTGGQYFRAQNTEDLIKIYNHIDKLEKTEIEVKQYNSFTDIYEPFLWFAFLLFMVELILGTTILFRVN